MTTYDKPVRCWMCNKTWTEQSDIKGLTAETICEECQRK